MARISYPASGFGVGSVAEASPQERTDFLHKTYQHLGLAILAFMGIEALLLSIPGIENLVRMMMGGMSWLLVLMAWMFVSRVAERWARSAISTEKQYMGLGLFVVGEAVLFVPLLYIASRYAGPSVIPTAGLITGVTFGGLTLMVMVTKKDFSFLGGILRIASFAALGLIAASLLFGFSLGLLFSFVMVIFASGAIVYQTSNVLHAYRPGQHVAAALGLFAGVALLFWYVLQLVMATSRD